MANSSAASTSCGSSMPEGSGGASGSGGRSLMSKTAQNARGLPLAAGARAYTVRGMEDGSRSATLARRLTPPRIAVLVGVLVIGVVAALAVPAGGAADSGPSPGAPSDAQVRADLKQARAELASFKRHLDTAAFLQTGPRARVLPDGMAVAPRNAPAVVKRVILAGNEIARLPYKWGGGHGAWRDSGYDCSGSVSFALAGAGLLDRPLTSGEFMSWGDAGPGRWITLYANSGHIFMVVAGLRFDTSGQGRAGTRWQAAARPVAGFAVRHPPGL